MSFFGGAPKMSSEEKFARVEAEVEVQGDLFTRLMDSCTRKCVPTAFNEAELNKGESVCIDRCVNKFMLVAKLIQEKIQEQQQQGGL